MGVLFFGIGLYCFILLIIWGYGFLVPEDAVDEFIHKSFPDAKTMAVLNANITNRWYIVCDGGNIRAINISRSFGRISIVSTEIISDFSCKAKTQ